MKPFRICLASSEVAPLAKTGGLADVTAGLSRYLGSVGHDVRLFMPLYKRIRQGDWELTPAPELQAIKVSLGSKDYTVKVLTTPLPNQDCGARINVFDYRNPDKLIFDPNRPSSSPSIVTHLEKFHER